MDPNNTPPVDPSTGGTPNPQPPQGGGPLLVPVQDRHGDHDPDQARDTNQPHPIAERGSSLITPTEAQGMLDKIKSGPTGGSFKEAGFTVADMTKLR